MNIIRLMSFVYALFQMLAMLVLLAAGKKHCLKRRHNSLTPMPLWGVAVWVLLAAAIGVSWYMWLTRNSILSIALNIWINTTGIPALGALICFDRSAAFMGRILDDERKSFVLVLVCTLLSVVLITLGIVLPGEA
ncbi:MAG: hypothetical protein KAR21_08165 [Spirochaetales bacterium]|nr:hypothetical protein [Spirochaetales bacterium]